MSPIETYQKILFAMNGNYDKKDKFLKRINKKSKKYRYFRVPEYEQYLLGDVKACYLYARHVVHGKLPEIMHNYMICESLANPKNDYITGYFKICDNNFDYAIYSREYR